MILELLHSKPIATGLVGSATGLISSATAFFTSANLFLAFVAGFFGAGSAILTFVLLYWKVRDGIRARRAGLTTAA